MWCSFLNEWGFCRTQNTHPTISIFIDPISHQLIQMQQPARMLTFFIIAFEWMDYIIDIVKMIFQFRPRQVGMLQSQCNILKLSQGDIFSKPKRCTTKFIQRQRWTPLLPVWNPFKASHMKIQPRKNSGIVNSWSFVESNVLWISLFLRNSTKKDNWKLFKYGYQHIF